MTEFKDSNNQNGVEDMPIEKCDSCGWQKRRLYDFKTKFGKQKRICQNCLMYHILFDDISEFNDIKQLDVFARLNSFYSYKSHQKEQNLFRLLLRYLWNIENPNITQIKEQWNRNYKSKKDPIEEYITRFQEIGILGDIIKNEDNIEIADWGSKIHLLIDKFVDAKERNDIDSWYYNIANIIKSAESLVGMSTELDRPTFDKSRNKIMKLFSKHCCDSDGKILEEFKKKVPLKKGGFECNYYDKDGNQCGMLFDELKDVLIHLDTHNVPKERKEDYVKRNEKYVGVWLRSEDMANQSDRVSYTNWQHAINRILKDQDFVIDLGRNEWLIEAGVADAMEKALIKTKDLIKEKVKEKKQ
jgi:hypothetical protein